MKSDGPNHKSILLLQCPVYATIFITIMKEIDMLQGVCVWNITILIKR